MRRAAAAQPSTCMRAVATLLILCAKLWSHQDNFDCLRRDSADLGTVGGRMAALACTFRLLYSGDATFDR